MNAASPEPPITKKEENEVQQVLKIDLQREKDEQNMRRAAPQRISQLKEHIGNSNINFKDKQNAMIGRLLKKNAIPHFQSQMNMTELNVYYRFCYCKKFIFHDKPKIAAIMLN